EGTGGDRGLRDAVELALVAEWLARPRAADDLERLAEARLALRVRDAVDVVRAHHAAPADAELEAALAELVDRRHLLGDAEGVIQRPHLHGRPHVEPPGARGDGGGHLERRRDHGAAGREVDLAEPHPAPAP